MSEDLVQETYILKPGVKITNAGNFFTLSGGDENTFILRSLKNIEFNTFFQPLDLEHLHQQIEDLARPLFVGGREGSTRWVDEDGLSSFVDRIVTLITQGEKE